VVLIALRLNMQKLKRGDVRDGMVFWAYMPTAKNGEWWITPAKFSDLKQKKLKPRPEDQCKKNNQRRRVKYAADEDLRKKAAQYNAERYKKLKASGEIKLIRVRNYKKRMQNPVYYLQNVCRARIWQALKGIGSKPTKTEIMLGCTYAGLRDHLESMFRDGMSWDNRGKWHIDHIVPLSSAKTEEDVIKLCHFTNLQPLWAQENKMKGNKQ
jgi:hypothetical protein